jgi:hypothetical protein
MDDIPHAAYFYTMATVAITFAGFASILMALRQGPASMSRFHLWVTRSYIQAGLVTAMCAMLPPLLFALGLSLDLTWRIASALIGFPALAMLMAAPRQWRAATDQPVQPRVWAQIGIGVVINTALIFNAAGWPWEPAAGPLMLAISWNLFAFFIQFAESVSFFFET